MRREIKIMTAIVVSITIYGFLAAYQYGDNEIVMTPTSHIVSFSVLFYVFALVHHGIKMLELKIARDEIKKKENSIK